MKNIMKWIAATLIAASMTVTAGEFSGGGDGYSGYSDSNVSVPAGAQFLVDMLANSSEPDPASTQRVKDILFALAEGGGSMPPIQYEPKDACEYPVWNPVDERVLITKVRVYTPNDYFSGGDVMDGDVETVEVLLEWDAEDEAFYVISNK